MNQPIVKTIVFVVVAALAILLSKWIYEAVMATSWPDWVKYMVLKS